MITERPIQNDFLALSKSDFAKKMRVLSLTATFHPKNQKNRHDAKYLISSTFKIRSATNTSDDVGAKLDQLSALIKKQSIELASLEHNKNSSKSDLMS